MLASGSVPDSLFVLTQTAGCAVTTPFGSVVLWVEAGAALKVWLLSTEGGSAAVPAVRDKHAVISSLGIPCVSDAHNFVCLINPHRLQKSQEA